MPDIIESDKHDLESNTHNTQQKQNEKKMNDEKEVDRMWEYCNSFGRAVSGSSHFTMFLFHI